MFKRLVCCVILSLMVSCQSSPAPCEHQNDLLTLRAYFAEYVENTTPHPRLNAIYQQRMHNIGATIWKILVKETENSLPTTQRYIYSRRDKQLPRRLAKLY